MSHIVQMSNANGPGVGQNGLSSSAKQGLISEWYSAVANTVRRAGVPPSTWTRSRWSRPAVAGALAQRVEGVVVVAALARAGSSRAWSQPRSENPSRTSTVWPARVGPHEQQAERAQRGLPDAVEVEPGAALDQPAVVPEHLPPAGAADLDVHRQRHALEHDRALRPAAAEVLDVGPQRDRAPVLDREAAAGEVDDDPRAAVLGERVPVDGDLLADGDLAADAGVEAWPRSSRGSAASSVSGPGLAERVERLRPSA